jgi:hypothetical protein
MQLLLLTAISLCDVSWQHCCYLQSCYVICYVDARFEYLADADSVCHSFHSLLYCIALYIVNRWDFRLQKHVQ